MILLYAERTRETLLLSSSSGQLLGGLSLAAGHKTNSLFQKSGHRLVRCIVSLKRMIAERTLKTTVAASQPRDRGLSTKATWLFSSEKENDSRAPSCGEQVEQ